MNFFNKIKTFFKNKFSKKVKEEQQLDIQDDIIINPSILDISIIKDNIQELSVNEKDIIDSSINNSSIIELSDTSNNIQSENIINEQNKDSLRDRYKKISQSEWFKKTHENIIDEPINITDISINKSVKKTLKKKKRTWKKISNNEEKQEQNIIQKTYKSKNPKYDKIVIFLTPGHTDKTPGKHSPDGKLYEWKYNRLIVQRIEKKLDELGIEHWNSHPEDSWVDKAHNNDNKDLQLRVQRINKKYEEVKKQGKTAIMLSIHVNAAGNGSWMNATGWSAWTTKGQNNSDKLADCLYEAAEELLKPWGKKLRYDLTDGDKDYESNFYVIKHVNCVAVLTENFFMDNMEDVEWLLSIQGQEYISLVHIEGIKKYIEKYIK